MRTISGISTAALLAWMLVGLSSAAQEPVASENTTASDNASATDTPSSQPSTAVSSHSKIRIVRLSEVKGEVQLDRQTGKGFESAMANLPVIEGERLQTGNGVAEVEFEDNSTVRVAQNSLVEFPRLELLPSGAKASAINVVRGTVYVSLVNTKGNEFAVNVGQNKITLPPDTHIRLQLTADQASLAVMHGDATVEQPSGTSTVGKDKTMTFSPAGQTQPVIAKNVTEQPLDSWDKDATQYHKSFANASSYGNSPYSYGINDLNYYGSFCLRVWRLHVAALFCQCELGSIRERRMGLLSERRLFLGFSLSLGLDTLPLRQLVLLSRHRLGLAAGRHVDGAGKQFVRLFPHLYGWRWRYRYRAPPSTHPCSDRC